MYGTPSKVIKLTGVTPEDIELTTDAELEAQLTEWLNEATDMINAECKRDFDAEVAAGTITEVPLTIINAAVRIASNMVELARRNRKDRIVNADGNEMIKNNSTQVFTPDVRQDISPYRKKSGFKISLAGYPDEELTV
jgi:uncharacterized protein with von Willebrand factor type A (vWA) domain